MAKRKDYSYEVEKAGKRIVYKCQSCLKEIQSNSPIKECPKCKGVCEPM
jgi:Zn finger protein HypA/HybF involved in hydrogenase expression